MSRNRTDGTDRRTTSRVAQGFALLMLAAAVAGCTVLGGADRRPIRSVTIHNHHFDPPQLTVPADTPFDLVVSALDMTDLTISSPPLGFSSVRVPATRRNPHSVKGFSQADLRKVRIPVAALSKGVYEISCDCHGKVVISRLVAE